MAAHEVRLLFLFELKNRREGGGGGGGSYDDGSQYELKKKQKKNTTNIKSMFYPFLKKRWMANKVWGERSIFQSCAVLLL